MVDMEKLDSSAFEIIGINEGETDVLSRPQVGYFKDAWRRFKKNKIAVAALCLLVVLAVLVIVGPYMGGNYDYKQIDKTARNLKPCAEHWFGTDKLGRDLWARVWVGGRVSIAIGIIGTLVSTTIGCIYGGISAYFGGKVDTVMMRIVEIIISLPYLIVVILMSILLNSKSMGTLILAMCATGWCGMARMVRAHMLKVKSEEYILAANAMGVSPLHIITKHMIPNVVGVIIVAVTFDVPGYISSEAFLSYMGLGIQPPGTAWGALANMGQQVYNHYPYQLFFPALMIALILLSFTLMGDGLRDALDPKMRK